MNFRLVAFCNHYFKVYFSTLISTFTQIISNILSVTDILQRKFYVFVCVFVCVLYVYILLQLKRYILGKISPEILLLQRYRDIAVILHISSSILIWYRGNVSLFFRVINYTLLWTSSYIKNVWFESLFFTIDTWVTRDNLRNKIFAIYKKLWKRQPNMG